MIYISYRMAIYDTIISIYFNVVNNPKEVLYRHDTQQHNDYNRLCLVFRTDDVHRGLLLSQIEQYWGLYIGR